MENKLSVNIDTEINEIFSKTILTQTFTNVSKNPIELKIYVCRKNGLIFSSFSAKIGDSIKVKSKLIKKEKAEEKYTDSISSGNAAIFVCNDPKNETRLIINMGNIPPKEKVEFESEFISFFKFNEKYEYELFRNFPIFCENSENIFENIDLNGKILIKSKSKNKIYDVKNEILFKDLKIKENKNLNDNEYSIKYYIEKLPIFPIYELSCYINYSIFIPCSKIFFSILNDDTKPIIYKQKSNLNENNYLLQYKITEKNKIEEDNEETFPSLFIFLIDQSGSMIGRPIEIVIQALKLFLQSLPVGSYYQLIGFGSEFKKYDEISKEYTKENIKKSIKLIDKLNEDLGGTNIYDPLKNIYSCFEDYDKINLSKNILLLTDGVIENKNITIDLIEENNSKFKVYSIGIGNSFDEDLIKSAGIIGKGGYNFCKDLNNLNNVVVSVTNKIVEPYLTNFEIKSQYLEEKSIIKNISINKFITKNDKINLNYILGCNKISDINEKINVEIKYSNELDGSNLQEEKYEIIPNELPEGEELSKLIINNYLTQNKNILTEEEKTKISLKYKILSEETSLFAEIELLKNITKKMKSQIIGDKKKNKIYIENSKGISKKKIKINFFSYWKCSKKYV